MRTFLNKNKIVLRVSFIALTLVSLIGASFFVIPSKPAAAEDDISGLNNQVEDRRREIDDLQKEIDAYKQKIAAKQKETRSLRNQLAIIENEVAKLGLDIQATEKKIQQTNLEIQALNIRIKRQEERIAEQKGWISEYIRLIYQQDQVSYLEVMLLNDSFSQFFDYFEQTEKIHSDLNDALGELKNSRQELENRQAELETQKATEEELKTQLTKQRDELDEKSTAQSVVLVQTKLSEQQYQNYVNQLQLEQQQINAEIFTLEKKIRTELESREKAQRFRDFGPARLAWPVDPSRGISAYFHDPDYPFRYIFEHPAIDVRVPQGTAIAAPEAGYVGKVKFAGDKSYAYIMLIHTDGISTVYGHVSGVSVKEDEFVTKGQVIGKTGGLPGSVGSGNLSTGAHLHFEVRLNGIPVNPLEYLPAL